MRVMRRREKKRSLTLSMVGMLVLGWLLPLVLIALVMLYFVSSTLSGQIEKTVTTTMDISAENSLFKLDEIMTASKSASYDNRIRNAYYEYVVDGDFQKLNQTVSGFLRQQYTYDASMLCTMLFFHDMPENIFYTYNTYQDNNEGNDASRRVGYFQEYVRHDLIAESNTLDTKTRLLIRDGHVYMVRNLVSPSYSPYAMIVIEINPDIICSSLDGVWGNERYQIYVDGERVLTDSEKAIGYEDEILLTDEGEAMRQTLNEAMYYDGGDVSFTYKTVLWEEQYLTMLVKLDAHTLIDDMHMIQYVFLLVGVFLVPLVYMTFRFFHNKVSRPVRMLVEAAEKITAGEYGYQMGTERVSAEFDYLTTSFNAMSAALKYQFETIYKEELELKDAKIMALQSQINPHFLNNTLEIINWEARMNGNDTVSSMIEALGTMLSATMNRRQRRFVTLAEELSYVDAYLYIISRRFGSRFRVHRDIDESLLDKDVPILIIQPIVENAVEHGVEAHKSGMVSLRIFSKGDKIIIEIMNDGTVSEADRKRIDFLLAGGQTTDKERHVSLGIRNVNRRIQIIYGKECGLTIQSDEENHTVSRIVVKMQHESNIRQ